LSKKDGKIYDSMTDYINEQAKDTPLIAGLADDPELKVMIMK
jgi:hypothetical protein